MAVTEDAVRRVIVITYKEQRLEVDSFLVGSLLRELATFDGPQPGCSACGQGTDS